MTTISYFQKYSQPENHLTNNTLLMLRHLYMSSSSKFDELISELCGVTCTVGLKFQQQVTQRNRNCYDGSIIQQPIDITVETKRGPNLNRDQIERYIHEISHLRGSSYSRHDGITILIGLTTRELPSKELRELSSFAEKRHMHFVSATFQTLQEELRRVCIDDPSNLREVYLDFEEYLAEEGVLEKDIMKAFACRHSLELNVKHRMYTVGADTPRYTNARIVGFYRDKCVTHIAEVQTIVEGIYNSDSESFIPHTFLTQGRDALEENEIDRIRSMNNESNYLTGRPFRYFLLGDIFDTNFKKESPSGLQRVKNFVLSDWVDDYQNGETTVKEVALALSDKNW